jgi:hypothetical protein
MFSNTTKILRASWTLALLLPLSGCFATTAPIPIERPPSCAEAPLPPDLFQKQPDPTLDDDSFGGAIDAVARGREAVKNGNAVVDKLREAELARLSCKAKAD